MKQTFLEKTAKLKTTSYNQFKEKYPFQIRKGFIDKPTIRIFVILWDFATPWLKKKCIENEISVFSNL